MHLTGTPVSSLGVVGDDDEFRRSDEPQIEPPLFVATLRRHVLSWTSRGFLAVTDEFLVSLSHLILNLALARWLSSIDYGAFTIAYSTFLLLGIVHTALLTEPLMVFGSSKYAASFVPYVRSLIKGHFIGTGVLGVLLAFSGVLLVPSVPSVGVALIYLGVCAPFILLPWLLRRACYARFRPGAAATGGALYCASVLAGLFGLAYAGLLSTSAALLLMAGASLLASVYMLRAIASASAEEPPPAAASDMTADHWRYGRWALGSGVLTWLPASIYYYLLPYLAGVEAAGELKAIMNLLLPVLHGYTALSMILLPALSGVRSRVELRSRVRHALLLYLAPALLYAGFLMVWHRQIFDWLYAGQYSGVSWLLPVAAPMVVGAGLAAVYATTLRALQRPDRVFWSYAWATGAALTVGVTLTIEFRLLGALVGLTLSYFSLAVAARLNLLNVMARGRAAGV